MPAYQVYLNDEQKDYLLKYICERRSVSMIAMWFSFVFIVVFAVTFSVCAYMRFDGAISTLGECSGCFTIALSVFAKEFITGFGKTFGHKCDIQCIEKDLYTLDYANFGYREKDTGKHPYYICDNRGDVYICPRFLDYRNADTGGHFLYIKLDNGRNYAIADD